MVLLRGRAHAAQVVVTCVAVLFISVAHSVPLPQKSFSTDFNTDFSATKNNGGFDFDFSSNSNIGGSNNPSSSFGGSSSGSGSFSGSSSGSGSFGGSNSQGTQPNFFEQLARSSQLIGSMVSSFFTSLGRQTSQGNGGSNLSPLVAIDTRNGAPTIDIPGILGLNTGHTNNGGGSSLVSVSTQEGTRVRAPFVNVDTRKGGSTRVQAPFTDIQTNSEGTRVRAPFTDVQTNSGGTRVQAPFTDVQTNSGGTRVQAPFTTVDHRKETNEIIVPSAQRNHITHTGSVFPARSGGISNFQLTPLSLRSRSSLTSNNLFPSAPKPTRHHPYLRASAPRRRVYQNPSPSRNMQKSKNFQNSGSITSTTSAPRPGAGNNMKFSTGLAGYQRIRFNSNLLPNYFREMNPSPNDIPDSLIRKGYNTPHKVRMYVIDKAAEMVEKATIVS